MQRAFSPFPAAGLALASPLPHMEPNADAALSERMRAAGLDPGKASLASGGLYVRLRRRETRQGRPCTDEELRDILRRVDALLREDIRAIVARVEPPVFPRRRRRHRKAA